MVFFFLSFFLIGVFVVNDVNDDLEHHADAQLDYDIIDNPVCGTMMSKLSLVYFSELDNG